MYVKRSIPCGLNAKQVAVVCRDLGRIINYGSSEREVAVASPKGLICQGWSALPGWVRLAKVRGNGGDVILSIDLEEGVDPGEVDGLLKTLSAQLASFFSYPVKPFQQRVFCIGWPRTGTTSLTEALRILGLFSWHFAPWVVGLRHPDTDEVSVTSFDLSAIADYTAVSDFPVYALVKELDEAFPGSLFILTTRDTEAWVRSTSGFAEELVGYYGNIGPIMRWSYDIDSIDEKIFSDRFSRHQQEMLEYFGDRKDLLVIDVTRGNPWPALCQFLSMSEPDIPFPHLNRRSGNSTLASKSEAAFRAEGSDRGEKRR